MKYYIVKPCIEHEGGEKYSIWEVSGFWIFKSRFPICEWFSNYYHACSRANELNGGAE